MVWDVSTIFYLRSKRQTVNIISPTFEIRSPYGLLTEEDGIKLLRFIEWNARISHRSEFAQTDQSWRRFIQAVVLERADWSVVEHAVITVVIRTDRAVCMELVRHRLFS